MKNADYFIIIINYNLNILYKLNKLFNLFNFSISLYIATSDLYISRIGYIISRYFSSYY